MASEASEPIVIEPLPPDSADFSSSVAVSTFETHSSAEALAIEAPILRTTDLPKPSDTVSTPAVFSTLFPNPETALPPDPPILLAVLQSGAQSQPPISLAALQASLRAKPPIVLDERQASLPPDPSPVASVPPSVPNVVQPEPLADDLSPIPLIALGTADSPIETALSVEKQDSWLSLESPQESPELHLPILIAGPHGLNPGLLSPALPSSTTVTEPLGQPAQTNAPSTDIPNISTPADSTDVESAIENAESVIENAETAPTAPFIRWDDLSINLNNSFSSVGEGSWNINPTLRGQFANGDTLTVSPGFNRFTQTDIEPVTHIPLSLAWKGTLNNLTLDVGGGVDLFDRLPITTHFNTTAALSVSDNATISMTLEQGPYASNARTLENQISSWRYGPDFYWQVTPKTSLFSQLRIGNYSDGNWEQQSYSRLERKIGEAATAALTLSNSSFENNVELTSGYFSPPDFLIATAELSWREQIAKGLSCGLTGSLGQQQLEGEWSLAYDSQVSCTVDVSSALQMNLGYRYSNVSNDQSALSTDSAYSNQDIFAGVSWQF